MWTSPCLAEEIGSKQNDSFRRTEHLITAEASRADQSQVSISLIRPGSTVDLKILERDSHGIEILEAT